MRATRKASMFNEMVGVALASMSPLTFALEPAVASKYAKHFREFLVGNLGELLGAGAGCLVVLLARHSAEFFWV